MRARRWGVAKFAAIPRKPSADEKQKLDSISHEFLALIPQEQFIMVQGIGIVQSDFYEITKDERAKSILGDTPYFLAYHFAMIQCAWAMKELEKLKAEDIQPWQKVDRDYVSFVCDETDRYAAVAHAAYRRLKDGNPRAAEYMASYSEVDEKKIPVMQAADAVAFEIRRALNLELGQWPGSLRKQFSILADAQKVFLIQHTAKHHLEHIVRTHEPGKPFKLDEIMDQVFHEDIRLRFMAIKNKIEFQNFTNLLGWGSGTAPDRKYVAADFKRPGFVTNAEALAVCRALSALCQRLRLFRFEHRTCRQAEDASRLSSLSQIAHPAINHQLAPNRKR